MKKITALFAMAFLAFLLVTFAPAVYAQQDPSQTPPSQQDPNQAPPLQHDPNQTPPAPDPNQAPPAQDPNQTPGTITPGQSDNTQQSQSLSGTLKSVDADAKKLVVTDSTGTDTEFSYNDQTEITGSQGSVAGLSGNAGSNVTVYYTDNQGQKTATRIEVKTADTNTPAKPGSDTQHP